MVAQSARPLAILIVYERQDRLLSQAEWCRLVYGFIGQRPTVQTHAFGEAARAASPVLVWRDALLLPWQSLL